ncbi:MAG: HEAT repeat domain-containing protein [Elusimicrobiota bacterium]
MKVLFKTVLLFLPFSMYSEELAFEKELLEFKETKQEIKNPVVKLIDVYDIRDMLRDKDPEIRKMAVKNSRRYINNSQIYEEILDIYSNDKERIDIRIESAKALSYVGNIYKIKDEIEDKIEYGKLPLELKVISYKALWISAESFSETTDFLVSRLKYDEKDSNLKKAIIWAMFSVSNNSRVNDLLIDIIKYGKEDNSIKIEAIKSLYNAMGNSRVKDVVYDIAKYNTSVEDKELRKTAIYALSARNMESSIKNFLEDLIKHDNDKEIKEVALKAYNPDPFEIYDFFHLSYKTQNGAFFNPIEKQ